MALTCPFPEEYRRLRRRKPPSALRCPAAFVFPEEDMDVYEPTVKTEATVVIVAGFPGAYNKLPFVRALGDKLAAAGLRAVAYENHDPVRDLQEVIARFDRVALWASSGNGPVALSALMNDSPVRCAVLHYAYTFGAADAAKQYGFVDGCAGKT